MFVTNDFLGLQASAFRERPEGPKPPTPSADMALHGVLYPALYRLIGRSPQRYTAMCCPIVEYDA